MKANWNQLKVTSNQLKSKLKSIQNKLKSIESKLKSIQNKLKSIEIYHFFLIVHYSVPGTLFFPHYSVTQICLGGASPH